MPNPDVSGVWAIVVATHEGAQALSDALDVAFGYPDEYTDHATEFFQHYSDGSVPPADQPWAVRMDQPCADAAASMGGYDAPIYLPVTWWPPRF